MLSCPLSTGHIQTDLVLPLPRVLQFLFYKVFREMHTLGFVDNGTQFLGSPGAGEGLANVPLNCPREEPFLSDGRVRPVAQMAWAPIANKTHTMIFGTKAASGKGA